MNLTEEETIEDQVVLEVYDGDNRIQVEFDSLDQLYDVVERDPAGMIEYFENNLFDSPEMSDPEDALLKMASTSGDEGLVTVPPEGDDEKLFSVMTTIFQKVAERSGNTGNGSSASDGFLQSIVRDQEDD
jgi:hypothetical protein